MTAQSTIISVLPSFLKAQAKRIRESPLGYRLARGAVWSAAGGLVARSLSILSSVVIARILSKVGFGELGIIYSTLALFQLFAGFGLGVTATKYVAEYRHSDPVKAGRIIGMAWLVTVATGATCALLLVLLAPWLAEHTLAAPHLSGPLRIMAITLFITALNSAQAGALSGFEAFRTIAGLNLVAGVFSLPILVTGVLLGGLEGAVWAMAVSGAGTWLIFHMAVRREARRFQVPLRFAGSLRELPLLWRFSMPAVLSGMMVTPVNWACNALLVNQPGGYAEMGVLNAANQWFNALLFVPNIAGSVILPILSERLASRNTQDCGRLLRLSIRASAWAVTPMVALGCLLSTVIMRTYGEGFAPGWPTLVVTLITAGLLSVQTPLGHVLTASGRMWLAFWMNTGWAVGFLCLCLLLVKHGSLGIASARLGAYVLHATWTFTFAFLYLRGARNDLHASTI
jgi:O-antigen/teichoic acid export membrane protein